VQSKVVVLLFLLPAGRLKNWLLRRGGCDVDRTARIGHILVFRVSSFTIGPGVSIGSFNTIKNLREVNFGASSSLGSWNWISGSPEHYKTSEEAGRFFLGRHSALTSRHYVDATGGFSIGSYTTVAGHRSMFLTHGIDIVDSVQTCAPIKIGDYSIVSAGVKIVPGGSVPSRSVVAMGSVILPGLEEEHCLYAGVPARAAKVLSPSSRYFHREKGVVYVRSKGVD